MRGILISILILTLTACSQEPYFSEGPERPERPEVNQPADDGEENPKPEEDEFLAEETVRLEYAGFNANAETPGILYTVDKDFTRATLRDLVSGNYATFSIKERNLSVNGQTVAYNLTKVKSDEDKGLHWWRGKDSDGAPVAIVLKRL